MAPVPPNASCLSKHVNWQRQREAARDEDPISNDALYQRLVAPRKLASVVELELRMRRSESASALVRRSEPTSALVSAANHMFWIIVLAILAATASPLE